MRIAVIGAGAIGRTLSGRLAESGHDVTVGVRSPGSAARDELDARVGIAAVEEAIAAAEAVIVAIPGAGVPEFAHEHGARVAGKVVIDTTNDLATGHAGSLNHVDAWEAAAPEASVARAFCSYGWENFAEPVFAGTAATLFWCGPDGAAGDVVEAIVAGVGLEPVRIGDLAAAATLDGVARLWFQLAFAQGMGRHVALRLLRGDG
jgi:8-hydroxy-5-deazaflavin:NADPH oxidoreductase